MSKLNVQKNKKQKLKNVIVQEFTGNAGLSVRYIIALGIDASDKWYGSFGVDEYFYA